MRDRIAAMALEPELEAIALVSLMEAADRVDSTAGLQMAYMK
jgi:adenine-specific DNA-methyltransferase